MILLLIAFSQLAFGGSFPNTSFSKYPVPKKGGTLVTSYRWNPLSFNPLFVSSVEDGELSALVCLPLFMLDGETNRYYPALATDLEISEDHKEYTYTLNENAKWVDGSAVTSDDFKFTFNRIKDSKTHAPILKRIFEPVTFKKIDLHHFKFIVQNPSFSTLSRLNLFRPVEQKQLENVPDINKGDWLLFPNGNGPYRVKSFSSDQSFVFERVTNWWAKDLPQFRARYNFDNIKYMITKDEPLAYERFIHGDLDVFDLDKDRFLNQVQGTDKNKFETRPGQVDKKYWARAFKPAISQGVYGIAFNLKTPVLGGVKTRQALAYLVDYDRIVTKDLEIQAVSPFGRLTPFTAPELATDPTYHLDPKKAISLLREDGWHMYNGKTIFSKDIDGKRTPLHIVLKFSGERYAKIGQILREQFLKAGVDLELLQLDRSARFEAYETKNYEAIIFGMGGSLEPNPGVYWHSDSIKSGMNSMSYSNPEVDALIDQAAVELNPRKRQKPIQEITRHLYEEIPFLFLYEPVAVPYGFSARVKSPMWFRKFEDEPAVDLYHF